ncbi:MAG TPA: GntR family transcriptional regulator [Chthonomonadaceae bacterium]|nr:GntR family transcriptional regulator [Chthonomonadaceae bacterium]
MMTSESRILYKKVYEVLRAGIANGTYPRGSCLPTEPELMAQFQVSRVTLRQALGMLKDEGLLVSIPAKGTFVAQIQELQKEPSGRVLAVLTPDVDSGFFSKIIRGIEREAYARGFQVVVHATGDLVEEEERLLRELAGHVAGFVVAAAAIGARSPAGFEPALSQTIPLVFVDRCLEEPRVDCVTSDNAHGGYLATRYLLDHGHARIGMIIPRECATYAGRIAGYRKALEEAGLPYESALVVRPDEAPQSGANGQYFQQGDLLARQLLALATPPTAIFVPNNMAAVGALKRLQAEHIAVPDRMALVGYDGVDAVGYVAPAITTVDQQPLQMGTLAARLLLARIAGQAALPQHFALPVELCVRESSEPWRSESRWARDIALSP